MAASKYASINLTCFGYRPRGAITFDIYIYIGPGIVQCICVDAFY